MDTINALGRRKAAIARIFVKQGKGTITVNDRKFEEYFTVPELKYQIMRPLMLLDMDGKFDIHVTLTGGGIKGQAEALRLAISRAIVKMNQDDKTTLKKEGLLTRDARVVERKKPGQPKARKRFQFSKR